MAMSKKEGEISAAADANKIINIASSTTSYASTKETNCYRLCRLLVDVGSHALRNKFDSIHPPAGLLGVLTKPAAHGILQTLREKRILNAAQWAKLYPPSPSSVSSKEFDVTLLMVLLKNICGLTPPATGWDNLPPAADTSAEANIARVKYYRNHVYRNASQASVDDATFNTYWQDISNALVGLGADAAAINTLKTQSMDSVIEKHYQELLRECKKDDDNSKDRLDEIEGGVIYDGLQQICKMEAYRDAGKTDPLLNLKKIAYERGFVISDNQGEGNCMFFAISEQLELIQGVKLSHKKLRKKVVRYLKENPTLPDGTELFHFVEGHPSWDAYLQRMKANGTWGDNVILHGAANCFDTCIHVISSRHHDVLINPQREDVDRDRLVLGHLCELHYVSLIPRKSPEADKINNPASATSSYVTNKETINHARLCRLLVDMASQVLREIFDSVHRPADLHRVLSNPASLHILQTLRKKRILNPIMWAKLYPPTASSVSSKDFDFTLLMSLLRNICGLTPPATGWDNLPPSADTSVEANIARVKYYRNLVAGLGSQASVDDATFISFWQDISNALVGLGADAGAIRKLRTDSMGADFEKHYQELLTKLKIDDDSNKDILDEIEVGAASIMTGCYDLEEPAPKRRRLDTTEDQSNTLSTDAQDKWEQSSLSSEVSTKLPRPTGRMFVEGSSTLTSKRKESFLSDKSRRQTIIRSPHKQTALGGEFVCEVVFALDFSSSVSEYEFQKEIDFVRGMSNSWNPENDLEDVVVYGNTAESVRLNTDSGTFSDELHGLRTEAWRQSKGRRMDLALRKAADNFTLSANEHVVFLVTAGRQVSEEERKEDDQELLVSATEVLSSKNIKVIILPVGLETDFRELGLIVRRPQYLFPLSSFDDMKPQKASDIASYIMETVDLESYAKKRVDQFSVIPPELSLWEISSLCSDVLEGAWYELYDNHEKSIEQSNIKILIRESIDNFQSTLVRECKVCVTLAVLGPLGVGKSFFLNFLLNLGLTDDFKVKNGPLPSAPNESQTPLPIYVKYGRKVQVLFHKQEADPNPVVWFSEEEMGKDTLARVNRTLLTKFQVKESFTRTSYVEFQGPFPVFTTLKSRRLARQGLHLELEVDVEIVDVPGLGDSTGDESIRGTLAKADVVLFFESGQSGRPVSAYDIAQVFRRRVGQFEFASRPKLVHIFNDRNPCLPESGMFESLYVEKKRNLVEAWAHLLSNVCEGDGIYKDVGEKLPSIKSEELLEKLSSESECLYFHVENTNFLQSLKSVIDDHVRDVKFKQTIHPFLQSVNWAAKMLKRRIVESRNIQEEDKKRKPLKFNFEGVIFRMLSGMYEAEESDLITSFLHKATIPLESDVSSLLEFLYNHFVLSSQTRDLLVKKLKKSLKSYTFRLITSFLNLNLPVVEDVPRDVLHLIEFLFVTRVKHFCSNIAPAHLLHFLKKKKNQILLLKDETLNWERASVEERTELVKEYLPRLLHRAEISLEDNRTRENLAARSHFQLIRTLHEDFRKLCAVTSFGGTCRADCLKSVNGKLQTVISFCSQCLRAINPHPNVDVRPSSCVPEEMVNAKEDDKIPSQSSLEEIISNMEQLLLNPGRKKAKDIIKEMETMLKFKKHGYLELHHPYCVDDLLWALALVNILSDEDHFNIQLKPCLVLDPCEARNEFLLTLARERLFAHQKSSATCKVVKAVDKQSPPENEIHLKRNTPEKCLEAILSHSMFHKLNAIHAKFQDPSHQLAPIFIPTIRPGQTPDIQGNFFLEEDPWSKASLIREENDEEDEIKTHVHQTSASELNIFLVVEPNHLETLKSTINGLRCPKEHDAKLFFIVLPQNGRGMGVTRAIIKIVAESLRFSLYWTIDDNIQFMYQFDGDDHRWHRCSITTGLLFGQRVFQSCLEKTKRNLSREERDDLLDDATSNWESWAKLARRIASALLIDDCSFSEVQKNPGLLRLPFAKMAEVSDGDPEKVAKLLVYEREFVAKCRKCLFEDTVNHISDVSLVQLMSHGSEVMSRYPKADYMASGHRSQVVLNNACALKGRNFVSDEVIFFEEEYQVIDEDKRNVPYWGIRGNNDSFHRALKVSGLSGYQVIRIVYKVKKLRNAFDRVGSLIASQYLHRTGDENEKVDMGNHS